MNTHSEIDFFGEELLKENVRSGKYFCFISGLYKKSLSEDKNNKLKHILNYVFPTIKCLNNISIIFR